MELATLQLLLKRTRRLSQTILLLWGVMPVHGQSDLRPMKPITRRPSPADKAARRFRRGVNIANYLEVPPGENWAMRHTVEDLKEIRAEGFDHIRLPVGWHYYTGPGPEYRLSPKRDFAGRADEMVTNAVALGLNVIVNLHRF